jgi:hypothetical protein
MSVRELNGKVTVAISRAEALEDEGKFAEARAAFCDVSMLEEELARQPEIAPPHTEGVVARDGAVRAALSAGLYARARDLSGRYLSEKDLPAAVVEGLRAMRDEAELALGVDETIRIIPDARVRFHDAA